MSYRLRVIREMNTLSETSLLLVNSISNVVYQKGPTSLAQSEQIITEISLSSEFPSVF